MITRIMFVGGALLLTITAAAVGLEAGAAKVDITPPIGTPLNGYGARMGQSSMGVHDSLWARTLFLDDGQTRIFLVTLDLCYINPDLSERIYQLAPDVVPREHIILTATHTHSGHGAMDKRLVARSVAGRFMPEVLEETARKTAKSMRLAYEARRRAALGFGVAKQTSLSTNRRIEGGPIDEQIGVVRIDDPDGNAIAIVANFAAHPTTVPEADLFSFSCDYLHFYYENLEELSHPGCVPMFTNGALGDQRTANPEDKAGWDRTESIGRLLAIRVKEVANKMLCGPATLRVATAEPELPLTLADTLQPARVFLQTLEINGDLLLNFFPGEPCAEIGLELRRRAKDRGYAQQFSVGCANNYLNYFVTGDTYHRLDYECGMNFFGPGIANWFYREFETLMSRGDPPDALPRPAPPHVEEVDGALRVALAGEPYAIGYQRGEVFAEALAHRFEEKVVAPLDAGTLEPSEGVWGWAPGFLDLKPLLLPVMGIAVRPLLEGISGNLFAELAGMADGARMPFDAVWLAQCAPYLKPMQRQGSLFETPFCTMFAAVGERAGADTLLVGRNLDWPVEETAVILEVTPNDGPAYVQVGFPWNAGLYTGMNEAGLVLCAERVPPHGQPLPSRQPLDLALRDVLATATTLEDAIDSLTALEHIHGFNVLVAGGGVPEAAVVEYGGDITVRHTDEGLLLGALPDAPHLENPARTRYKRVTAMIGEEGIVSHQDIAQVLADAQMSETGRARIWNDHTRHTVVFEPMAARMHVAFPTVRGEPGTPTTITVAPAAEPAGTTDAPQETATDE
ncbi:MAG: neutral/alkaline non-lysosomal ceramidase N-terminal domain-containing protein [Candidatus Hydrogenedentota bacterium]